MEVRHATGRSGMSTGTYMGPTSAAAAGAESTAPVSWAPNRTVRKTPWAKGPLFHHDTAGRFAECSESQR